MPANNPADPWSMDYFNPKPPHVDAPAPASRAPKMVPGLDDLFTVQRNALKVLNDLHTLDQELKGKIPNKLLRDAEHTYRVIRTYLEKHA
jgi:hypothetical protein